MARFILRRLVRALVTLILFQTILFLLIQAIPGDFVSTMLGMPPSLRQAMRRVMGLDAPLWQQYLRWMGQFFSGRLGETYQFPHRPVIWILAAHAPRTLLLFLPAAVIALGLGLWLGRYLGWRRRSWWSAPATGVAIACYTAFPPWLAFLLVQVFALKLRWFPAEGILGHSSWRGTSTASDVIIMWLLLSALVVGLALLGLWRLTQHTGSKRSWLRVLGGAVLLGGAGLAWTFSGWLLQALDLLWHLILPLTTLVLLSFGESMLLMRVTMQDTLYEDYVLAARAKGLPDSLVRDRHVARLAMLPVLARFIIQLPFVLIGSFAVEGAFHWQGMGYALFQAVDIQDIPVLMGILSIVGVAMLAVHVALDILHAWLDPRVRTAAIFSGR
jgi:peptide/nickel transport system permease protein